jgi:hypothetical protein
MPVPPPVTKATLPANGMLLFDRMSVIASSIVMMTPIYEPDIVTTMRYCIHWQLSETQQ